MRAGLIIAAIAILVTGNVAAQTAPPATELPPVEVVGASPLIGSGIDRNTIPAETHVLDSSDISRQGTPDLVKSLNQQVGGVSLDSASGNPFQPTLLYHGFAASGLQGTPQGLAVYVNGLRFNQPFGDTVDWDLIPNIAIDRINVEGSNPVFGLNALGGAVNIQLKNGFTWQGFETDLSGGSFGQILARCCTRTAGAICNRRTCRTSMAISVGEAIGPSCTSTSWQHIPSSTARARPPSSCWPQHQPRSSRRRTRSATSTTRSA